MMKKIRFITLIALLLMFTFSINTYASETMVIENEQSLALETRVEELYVEDISAEELPNGAISETFISDTVNEIELIKDKNGNFESEPIIYSTRAGQSIIVTFSVARETYNSYEIQYKMASNGLVNGLYCPSVKVSSTSLLFPTVYTDRILNKGFVATMLYYNDIGNFQASSDLDKVRVKTTGLEAYSMQYGWVSLVQINSAISITN